MRCDAMQCTLPNADILLVPTPTRRDDERPVLCASLAVCAFRQPGCWGPASELLQVDAAINSSCHPTGRSCSLSHSTAAASSGFRRERKKRVVSGAAHAGDPFFGCDTDVLLGPGGPGGPGGPFPATGKHPQQTAWVALVLLTAGRS